VSDAPAAAAGIAVDDVIATINGKATQEYRYEELRELFSQIGVKVKLTVLRGEESESYVLQLRRLI